MRIATANIEGSNILLWQERLSNRPIDLSSPSTQNESSCWSTMLQVRKEAKGAIDLLIPPTSITMTRFINFFFLKLVIYLCCAFIKNTKSHLLRVLIAKWPSNTRARSEWLRKSVDRYINWTRCDSVAGERLLSAENGEPPFCNWEAS